jgi:hypothetical protein
MQQAPLATLDVEVFLIINRFATGLIIAKTSGGETE